MKSSDSYQDLPDTYDSACRMYIAYANAQGAIVETPSESLSGELTVEGEPYFALRNSHRFLAIFKIAKDGQFLHQPDFDLESLDTSY